MKTKLQKHLATIAPSVSIRTIWEPDQDSGTVSQECDGFTRAEDEEWTAWQSEIRATAITNGEEITGSAYLGGTFERAGDLPEFSNPTISDYEPQMTLEALESLPEASDSLAAEVCAAIAYLHKFMADEYAKQRATAARMVIETKGKISQAICESIVNLLEKHPEG